MEQSLAMELLQDFKKANKRMFILLLVVLIMWFGTGCYLIYVLNDISEITNEQEIVDVETIENSSIVNGG